jgi:hypothetical protein
MRLLLVLAPGLALATSLSLLLAPGCGSETGSGTTTGDAPDADDGKVHPPGNGKPTSEAAACNALIDAQSQRYMALGCASTTRVCPDFVRSQSGVECLQYDEGAVQGCAKLYADATTCKAVAEAAGVCVVATIAGSAPNGCP